MPSATPITPPMLDSRTDSIEKLPEDVASAGADGQADADLAGPLGHRDEHDVHDPDAADHQRDAGDRGQQAASSCR